jgi:plastocyanin
MTPLRRTPLPAVGARLVAGVVAAVLVAAISGCSTSKGASDHSTSASGSSTQTKNIDVTVKGDKVTPAAEPVTVAVGEKVELHVTSDRDGELHVHSSPEHEFEFKPGSSTFSFTLDQPGSVVVEEHVSDSLVLKLLVQ